MIKKRKSFKVSFENQTKRINGNCNSLKELMNFIQKTYSFKDVSALKLYYYNNITKEKMFVEKEEDYKLLLEKEQNSPKSIRLFLDANGRKISIDESSLNLSEYTNLKGEDTDIIENRNMNKIKSLINNKISIAEKNMDVSMASFLNEITMKTLQVSKSNIDKRQRFFIQCDNCLIYPVYDVKYICLICDDFHLCSECEKSHNHPVIKFKTNEFATTDHLCQLLVTTNTNYDANCKSFKEIFQRQQEFFSSFKSKIVNFGKYKVRFETIEKEYTFRPNTHFYIPFILHNEGSCPFPNSEIVIYVKNCKDLFIKLLKFEKELPSKENLHLQLEGITSKNCKDYRLELHIFNRDLCFEYSTVILKINVCDNPLNEENYDINKSGCSVNFSPEDNVSILPVEKKEILAKVFLEQLSDKDLKTICIILEKYNWQLSQSALDELK
jgi:hypothetical protein